jgi:hypothetical protein
MSFYLNLYEIYGYMILFCDFLVIWVQFVLFVMLMMKLWYQWYILYIVYVLCEINLYKPYLYELKNMT